MDDTKEIVERLTNLKKQTKEINDRCINILLSRVKFFPIDVDIYNWMSNNKSLNGEVNEMVETQVRYNYLLHKLFLLHMNVDNYFDRVLTDCLPKKSDSPLKVIKVLEDTCSRLGCRYPEFSCQLVASGSYYDGSKITSFNEMDFIFKLKYKCYRDYSVIIGHSECHDIVPSEHSILQKYCDNEGKLDANHFMDEFEKALSVTIQESCKEMQLEFGGYDRPYFSGFVHNEPALTLTINDIVVDITLAFESPHHLTWKVLNVRADSNLLRCIKRTVPNYARLGVLLVAGRVTYLTTARLECFLLRRNRDMLEALKICKYYKDNFLNVHLPDLSTFCETFILIAKKKMEQALRENGDTENAVWGVHFSMTHPDTVCLVHRAARLQPITGDVDQLALHTAQMSGIQEGCRKRVTRKWMSVYPSVGRIVNEEVKPLRQTTSFLFKSIILKVFFQKRSMTTMECVLRVFQEYQRYLSVDRNVQVIHPLLGRALPLLKLSKDVPRMISTVIPVSYIDDIINDLRRSVADFEIAEEVASFSQIEVTSSTGAQPLFQIDRDNPNDFIDCDYLDNGDLIVASRSGLSIYNATGLLISHPLSNRCKGITSGVCVDRRLHKVAVTEGVDQEEGGLLHVFELVDDGWHQRRHVVCQFACQCAMTRCGNYVVRGNNSSLYKYDKTGDMVWCQNVDDSFFTVHVDSQNRIVICTNGSIWTFNQDGFPKIALRRGQLDIRCLCLGGDDSVVVYDEISKSILRINSQLNHAERLLKVNEKPQCLAVFQDKFLAVGYHHTLEMFELL